MSFFPISFRTLSRTLRSPFNRWQAFRRLREYHSKPRKIEEIVDWAMHFGGSGHFKIFTMQIPSEITALAQAVAAIRPSVILEIGTARGGTLLIWSALASELVITCDLEEPGTRQELYGAFPPPGSGCRVVTLRGDSHQEQMKRAVAGALNGRQVDFLFIDGDHVAEGVEADYRDYRTFVRPGGIIAFHDIAENQVLPTNQVQHFWKRLKKEAVTEDLVADPDQCGYGIGIIRVPL